MFARDGGVGTSMHPPARRLCNSSQNRFPKKGRRQNLRLFYFLARRYRKRDRGNEMLQPTENEFEQLAAKGFNLIPVFEEVAADLETPVSAFLKIARDDYAFLLESVRGGEKWGRYTFLGSEPSFVMRARRNRLDLIRPGRGIEVRSVENSFEALRAEVKRFRAPELPNLPRFFGGAVGFLAYDIVRCFEKIPETAVDDLGTPDFHLMFTDTVLCFDNVRQTLKIIANVPIEEFASTKMAYQSARIKIDEIIERLKRPAVPPFLEGANV